MSLELKNYPKFTPLPSIKEEVLYFENVTLKNKIKDTLVETIEFKNCEVKSDIVGNSIVINGGQVHKIDAIRKIKLTNCSAGDIFCQEGSIDAFNCAKLASVNNFGRGDMSLVDCGDVQSVNTQGNLKLNCTNVEYGVQAQGKAILYHSQMRQLDYTPVYGINPSFENCTIKTLTIHSVKKQNTNGKTFGVSSKNNELPSIKFNNCKIGTLIFKDKIKKAVIFGTSSIEKVIGGEVVKGIDDDELP